MKNNPQAQTAKHYICTRQKRNPFYWTYPDNRSNKALTLHSKGDNFACQQLLDTSAKREITHLLKAKIMPQSPKITFIFWGHPCLWTQHYTQPRLSNVFVSESFHPHQTELELVITAGSSSLQNIRMRWVPLMSLAKKAQPAVHSKSTKPLFLARMLHLPTCAFKTVLLSHYKDSWKGMCLQGVHISMQFDTLYWPIFQCQRKTNAPQEERSNSPCNYIECLNYSLLPNPLLWSQVS